MSARAPKRARRPRTDPGIARETVLDAAEALLRAEGPGALRLGEIAARAGLSHSNVLYHFAGMKDLESQLGRRIALRLAEELAEMHRRSTDLDELATGAAARLLAVLGRPENARLVWWMLESSQPEDLAPLTASIRSTCELVAANPAFAALPREAVMREVTDSTGFMIAGALGLGIVRPWAGAVLGAEVDDEAFAERLGGAERTRMERRLAEILTTRQ